MSNRTKVYHWREAPPRKTDEEIQADIQAFISRGGRVTKLSEDNGEYEKLGNKMAKKLRGLVRPFSKEDALRRE